MGYTSLETVFTSGYSSRRGERGPIYNDPGTPTPTVPTTTGYTLMNGQPLPVKNTPLLTDKKQGWYFEYESLQYRFKSAGRPEFVIMSAGFPNYRMGLYTGNYSISNGNVFAVEVLFVSPLDQAGNFVGTSAKAWIYADVKYNAAENGVIPADLIVNSDGTIRNTDETVMNAYYKSLEGKSSPTWPPVINTAVAPIPSTSYTTGTPNQGNGTTQQPQNGSYTTGTKESVFKKYWYLFLGAGFFILKKNKRKK